ncbi:hypothetical protein Neosp_012352 [[Neocosmospora] mangrovei]
MWKLVYAGLDRSKKQAEFKEAVADVLGTVDKIKGIVDKAVKYSPEASSIWAGASLGLEILANPVIEPGINRKGIAYVLSRMEWYWNLADIVLDKEIASSSSADLRENLQNHVVDLYKKLLLFQMRSVCLYDRNGLSVVLRDAIKLDDWTDKIKEVKDAETLVQKDLDQFTHQDMRVKLKEIRDAAWTQEQLFRQEVTRLQKMEQDNRDRECLAKLLLTDPRKDKERIQTTRGNPLWDSYHWILEHPGYDTFTNDPSSRVLWIKGDCGKGKTMLLCGIIDQLDRSTDPLSYFFCMATEKHQSSDTDVMRGLIYTILDHYPSLMPKLRAEYDKTQGKLFEMSNVNLNLQNVLTDMLKDPILEDAVFVIDSLDECITDRPALTKLIVHLSSSCRPKWIVSSRVWPEIQKEIGGIQGLVPITLEDEKNRKHVAKAVQSYIRARVDELAKKWDEEDKDSEGDESENDDENDNNKIDNEDLKRRVYDYMVANAEDTFLWVALVCQRLTESNVYKHRVLEELEQIPKGLHDLYKLMMDRILTSSESDRLKAVLTTACLAHRPLKSKEMAILVESMERYDEKAIRKTVRSCGSFLAYQDRTIYFVHQSAKEYLLDKRAEEIIPHGLEHHHLQISLRCLDVLKSKIGLKEDIYGLGSPGASARGLSRPKPDPLAPLEYLCLHWTKHLIDSGFAKVQDAETVNKVLQFFQAKFTSWLEALSLLGHLSVAVESIANIESALKSSSAAELIDFLWDARRFILNHAQVIGTTPLQVYSSALIFSPRSSKVREKFEWQVPEWIVSKPEMPEHWDACVQTLYIHTRSVGPLSFSPDGKLLAICREKQVHIFEVALGTSSYQLNLDESLASVAFSPCGTKLAVASQKGTIMILELGTLKCIQTLEDGDIYAVTFSPDGEQLATISADEAHVWNWRTGGNPVNVLQGHGSYATSVAFLPKGKLVTGSDDGTAKIWILATNSCEQTLQHDASVWSVTCSSDGGRLATGSRDKTAKIWHQKGDTGKWVCSQTLQHKQEVRTVCFSPDGRVLISGSLDNGLRLWDEAGVCIKTLYGHTKRTTSLSVTSTGKLLASGSADGTVKVWDIFTVLSPDPPPAEEECSSSLGDYVSRITSLSFSPDGQILISHSEEGETKLWNIGETCCTLVQEVPESYQLFFENPTIASAWLSHISLDEAAAMRDREGGISIWNMTTKKLIHRLDDKNTQSSVPEASTVTTDAVDIPDSKRDTARPPRHYKFGERLLVVSPDHEFLATSSKGDNIRVWDTASGECLLMMQKTRFKKPLALSRDPRYLFIYDDSKTWVRKLHSAPFPELDSGQTGTSKRSLRLTTQLGVLEAAVSDRVENIKLVGWGLILKGDWICRGAELMLWIPPQYRKLVLDALRKRFAVICPSGRIVMLQVA